MIMNLVLIATKEWTIFLDGPDWLCSIHDVIRVSAWSKLINWISPHFSLGTNPCFLTDTDAVAPVSRTPAACSCVILLCNHFLSVSFAFVAFNLLTFDPKKKNQIREEIKKKQNGWGAKSPNSKSETWKWRIWGETLQLVFDLKLYILFLH